MVAYLSYRQWLPFTRLGERYVSCYVVPPSPVFSFYAESGLHQPAIAVLIVYRVRRPIADSHTQFSLCLRDLYRHDAIMWLVQNRQQQTGRTQDNRVAHHRHNTLQQPLTTRRITGLGRWGAIVRFRAPEVAEILIGILKGHFDIVGWDIP